MPQELTFFRPPWCCGHYSLEKHVALLYNTLSGRSFFFESYSADVANYILKTTRGCQLKYKDIVEATGIAEKSITVFFKLLCANGLITSQYPSTEYTQQYRNTCAIERKNSPKLNDDVSANGEESISTAEQSYYEAVAGDDTITTVMFELTYRCNERCIHCYNPGATRNDHEVSFRDAREELSFEDYKSIIDQLCDCGLTKVILSGGDPFVCSFIWELIDYLYYKELAIDIYTNGQAVGEKIDKLSSYYPHLIGVSIYSGVAADHDYVTRVKGSWERTMSTIRQLSEMSITTVLKCCIMQQNLHSYYLVQKIADEYGATAQYELNVSDSNDGDRCARLLRLNEEQLMIVLRDKNLRLYVGPESPNYGRLEKDLSTNGCGAGNVLFCISPEGNLQPCCAFPMILGNLKKQTIKQIISDNHSLSEWKKTPLMEYTDCGKHEYCDYCNLCVGLNYVEHNDYRKPSENCCHIAKTRYSLVQRLMDNKDPLGNRNVYEAINRLPTVSTSLRRIKK